MCLRGAFQLNKNIAAANYGMHLGKRKIWKAESQSLSENMSEVVFRIVVEGLRCHAKGFKQVFVNNKKPVKITEEKMTVSEVCCRKANTHMHYMVTLIALWNKWEERGNDKVKIRWRCIIFSLWQWRGHETHKRWRWQIWLMLLVWLTEKIATSIMETRNTQKRKAMGSVDDVFDFFLQQPWKGALLKL